jgi:enoyl-CoA hydratase/carnithine racemase
MQTEKELFLSKNDGIATITFNRPAHMNRLGLENTEECIRILRDLEEREEERVLIITGAGEEYFCMGGFATRGERATLTSKEVWRRVNSINHFLAKIEQLPMPVIAAINGKANGAGVETMLACDLRIACSHATFRVPETSLGVFAGAGAPVRLPRVIGPGRAKDMMFTGREVGIEEAERMGLVDRVIPSDSFRAEVQKIAETIRDNAPLGNQAVKKVVNMGIHLSIAEAQALSDTLRRQIEETEDAKEGIKAVLENRKPRFVGR